MTKIRKRNKLLRLFTVLIFLLSISTACVSASVGTNADKTENGNYIAKEEASGAFSSVISEDLESSSRVLCTDGENISEKMKPDNMPYFESEDYSDKAYEHMKNMFLLHEKDGLDFNGHDAVRDYIVSNLEKAGFKKEEIVCKKKDGITNISVIIKGNDGSKRIIVGAHYDGTGASDNCSGSGLLLSAACALKEKELKNKSDIPPYDLVMIFFDAEEIGLLGSIRYVSEMSDEDIEKTLYMLNMDALIFGDYCNIYSSFNKETLKADKKNPLMPAFVSDVAAKLGIKTYFTKELDGYFAENGKGPDMEKDALYTNPWTSNNPSPLNFKYESPSTGLWSDHAPFAAVGINYLYFEASNWFSEGDGGDEAYTGYFETYDKSLGYFGKFMNTEFDTMENMEKYFPGRAKEHLSLYSRLLTAFLSYNHDI